QKLLKLAGTECHQQSGRDAGCRVSQERPSKKRRGTKYLHNQFSASLTIFPSAPFAPRQGEPERVCRRPLGHSTVCPVCPVCPAFPHNLALIVERQLPRR